MDRGAKALLAYGRKKKESEAVSVQKFMADRCDDVDGFSEPLPCDPTQEVPEESKVVLSPGYCNLCGAAEGRCDCEE